MTKGRLSLGRKPHKNAGEPRACEPGVEWAERQDPKAAVAYRGTAGGRAAPRATGGGTRSASGHHTVLDARVHSAHSAPRGWLCVHTKIPTPQSAHDPKLSFVTGNRTARAHRTTSHNASSTCFKNVIRCRIMYLCVPLPVSHLRALCLSGSLALGGGGHAHVDRTRGDS